MTDHIKTLREALETLRHFAPFTTNEALAAIDALEAENARLKDLLGKANTLARIRWERLCQLQGRSINEDNSDQQGYTAGDMASAAAQGFRDGQAATQQAQAEAVPSVKAGHKRQWARCRICGRVAHYDYVPYSLSAPIMTMPCGHGAGERDMGADRITPEQAYTLMAAPQQAEAVPQGAIDPGTVVRFAVDRWLAEVANRPLANKHRRTLDDTWRQVIRRFGGDPDALLGPDHDSLLAAAPQKEQSK